MTNNSGGFTLPGEAGYEQLTLDLARRWGADAIRDSDGTRISPAIIEAGYDIYSTICVIRDHNEWIRRNPQARQQTFLMSAPVIAEQSEIAINLLDGYFQEQFTINDKPGSIRHWQVFDRTSGQEMSRSCWTYDDGWVTITSAQPYHRYTVNFLAYRIWEEISMYNHVTNNWDNEHLMQLDPRYPEARAYLADWLEGWCREHQSTSIVRFTSLFYNFVWIWGDCDRHRNRFADWGSYDFTVSDKALEEFEAEYGYQITSEDFINKGRLHSTHMPAGKRQKDWIDFTQKFVADFASILVRIVHQHGKLAYVFYDDSWIGMEPYGRHFETIGFDGLIKCVFSGYEARLCANCRSVKTHELRLHPYLFPIGLGGQPTFSPGGHPELDAKRFWVNIRRALLRQPVDRLGLGGYLHLVENQPAFLICIDEIIREFHNINACHAQGKPASHAIKVGVLHAWGGDRPWTLSGHFHESSRHVLIHLIECLAGLPVEVEFLSFADIRNGRTAGIDVILNAGRSGDAWSGGENWDGQIEACMTEWVYQGGALLGVQEPGAATGGDTNLRISHILGVELDQGEYSSHGHWAFEVEKPEVDWIPAGIASTANIFLSSPGVKVYAAADGVPLVTENRFGQGVGVYLADFSYNAENIRKLMSLLIYLTGAKNTLPKSSHLETDCAYFPESGKIFVVNGSEQALVTNVEFNNKVYEVSLEAFGMADIDI